MQVYKQETRMRGTSCCENSKTCIEGMCNRRLKESHSNARNTMEEKTFSGASAEVKGKRNGKGKDKHSKVVGDGRS